MGVGGKEKMVLTAEEMDTILQQTTEATLNLEEEQRRQGVKTGDAKQQQRSVQEDKGLHVMYMKDSGSEEVSFVTLDNFALDLQSNHITGAIMFVS